MPNTPTTTDLFLRNIPRGVRDHFKAWCAKRGVTMKEKLTDLMRDTIKKGDTLETARPTRTVRDSISR